MTKSRSVFIVLTGLILLASFSFTAFIRLAILAPDPHIPQADGIVVLTGGRDRINDAVALLTGGKGQRLLISGVHDKTSTADLVRIEPKLQQWIDCCVDLDRKATNTIGNAVETIHWAHEKGYASLIVVTSHYHMPRALQEFHAGDPRLQLIAYPVVPLGLDLDHWWSDSTTIRLLFGEWIKDHGARLRISLGLSGMGSEATSDNSERQDP